MTSNKQSKMHARAIQEETGKSYADSKRISSSLHDIRDIILRHPHDPALAQFQIMDVLRSAGVEIDANAEQDSSWVMLMRACELTDTYSYDTHSRPLLMRWTTDQAGEQRSLRLISSSPRVADTLANLYENNGLIVLAVHDSLEMADETLPSDVLDGIVSLTPGIAHSMDSTQLRIRREDIDIQGLVQLMERSMSSFAHRIPY